MQAAAVKENGQRAPFFMVWQCEARGGFFFQTLAYPKGRCRPWPSQAALFFDPGLQAPFFWQPRKTENAQTGNRARRAQAGIGETGHAGTLLSLHVTER